MRIDDIGDLCEALACISGIRGQIGSSGSNNVPRKRPAQGARREGVSPKQSLVLPTPSFLDPSLASNRPGAFQAYRAIPELGRYQSWSPQSAVESLQFLGEMNETPLSTPGEWMQLGIAEPQSDALVGDIGLYLSDDGKTGEVGFTLQPSSQGRGIAGRAVQEALRLLFTATDVTYVLGITDARNAEHPLAGTFGVQVPGNPASHLARRRVFRKGVLPIEMMANAACQHRRPTLGGLPGGR